MGKIKHRIKNRLSRRLSPENDREAGFSYIETLISMVVLIIGLLGALSAMTFALLFAQVAEKKTQAKEIAGSYLENIFAIRDIQSQGDLAISGWDAMQIKAGENGGIFVGGWYPVRDAPGADGIYGTTDDSCAVGGTCTTAAVVPGYERNINISDITENGVVRKRLITVEVRYRASGGVYRTETLSTIVANLPTS